MLCFVLYYVQRVQAFTFNYDSVCLRNKRIKNITFQKLYKYKTTSNFYICCEILDTHMYTNIIKISYYKY